MQLSVLWDRFCGIITVQHEKRGIVMKTITVKGIGSASVKPDLVEVTMELCTRMETYESAMERANEKIGWLTEKLEAYGTAKAAADCGIGEPTLLDIARELAKPGRDPRDDLPAPILRKDVLEMKDLRPGMELTGTVRNVIDFGVFVDIGVHQDGLVHISQVANRRLRHPSEAVKVGDVVNVVVLEVDEKRHRISLSMKQAKQN